MTRHSRQEEKQIVTGQFVGKRADSENVRGQQEYSSSVPPLPGQEYFLPPRHPHRRRVSRKNPRVLCVHARVQNIGIDPRFLECHSRKTHRAFYYGQR